MKAYLLTIILFTIVSPQLFAQSDTGSVYKALKTKKFYRVSLSSQSTNGRTVYKVNGKNTSKATYEKYNATWENMETCCPCILLSYNEKDVLIEEGVSCTDCGVGAFKKYYPNGNIQLIGSYKENPTGNWKNIWQRGYCSMRNGTWIYFNEKGDTLYSEIWDNGEFVKQVPEQKINEIWKVELTLDGKQADKMILTPEQVKQLTISPKYKNSSKPENNLTIKFQVSAVGYRQNEKDFTIDDFKKIDVLQMLSEVGIPSEKSTSFDLSIVQNGIVIANFILDVKH